MLLTTSAVWWWCAESGETTVKSPLLNGTSVFERLAIRCLAGLYGPSRKPWPNDVTPDNAQEVADALERALKDWPDPWDNAGLPIFPWGVFSADKLREIIADFRGKPVELC
jgi:hypothetical protein